MINLRTKIGFTKLICMCFITIFSLFSTSCLLELMFQKPTVLNRTKFNENKEYWNNIGDIGCRFTCSFNLCYPRLMCEYYFYNGDVEISIPLVERMREEGASEDEIQEYIDYLKDEDEFIKLALEVSCPKDIFNWIEALYDKQLNYYNEHKNTTYIDTDIKYNTYRFPTSFSCSVRQRKVSFGICCDNHWGLNIYDFEFVDGQTDGE